MTSGPMPINALPPDRQPVPQVVAWMRDYLRVRPEALYGDVVHAYRRTHGMVMGADQPPTWDDLYAAEAAARKPLTVADIPAGQGPASLYVDGESTAVMYRTAEGRSVPVPAMWVPTDDDGMEALNAALAALAATLPTIDATEEGS